MKGLWALLPLLIAGGFALSMTACETHRAVHETRTETTHYETKTDEQTVPAVPGEIQQSTTRRTKTETIQDK